MRVDQFDDSPLYSVISFHKVVESLQNIAKEKKAKYRAEYAKSLLKEVEKVPELYSGITSKKVIYDNVELIHNLLADLFPTALTHNEIKAVSLPFQNFNFNFTKRFQQIIHDAGDSFEINIRDFTADKFYILSCCLILNEHYGENFDITRPLFYDIPDKDGIMKHYRITYNADFTEVIPTEKAIELTREDINLLKKNYDNLALWREKFPKHSWILKGFGILTLFDVTIDNSISTLKSNLIKGGAEQSFNRIIQKSFSSIFKIANLKVGLNFINDSDYEFISMPNRVNFESYFNYPELLENEELKNASLYFFKTIAKGKDLYCVSDIDDLFENEKIEKFARFLKSQGIESFILAKLNPIDGFQGFIEIISNHKYALHSVNSTKLDDVIPLINDTIERVQSDIKNNLEAIIQREYTAIHPSVYWKFLKEARSYFYENSDVPDYLFKEVEFQNVFPLYGETDIKGSTFLRNKVTFEDVKMQLEELIGLFRYAKDLAENLLFDQRFKELSFFLHEIKINFSARLEFQIQNYIVENIHPVLNKLVEFEVIKAQVLAYYSKLNKNQTKYYQARKRYDLSITTINKNLAEIIDQSQVGIQKVFSHYFERFKSDGIEHNMFIGSTISPDLIFDNLYLFNLRLWQIQVMCQMVRKHYNTIDALAFHIDLTSLIFVYNYTINIRFRLDEKRFDVSGNSDVRYQVIKKRIDKACIKNTTERIVQPEYLTIVYMNEIDKVEYIKYIEFLKKKFYFIGVIQDLEIEDLQDITGLKALRIKIDLDNNSFNNTMFTYTELVQYNAINL